MQICGKKSVLFVILFPDQVTNSSNTTRDMFSNKYAYQATTEENLAEDHKGLYMKKSNTLADNAVYISLGRNLW